ncbi:erythrocyte membrane protein 1, PfEMP1, putative [Plasmodium sp. gorilla clade G1]|nr:erythrocyte membrane protein 1, PfEMP1, putative [Plasmodium sp. gorilla clade G1]
MGTGSSTPSVPKDVKYESHKSARNVLENIAQVIRKQVQKDAKEHTSSLEGDYKRAKFKHDFFKIKSDMPGNPCDLDFAFHSNTPGGEKRYRHPCARSMNKNLSTLEGAVCTNSKIKGNEKKINGAGACAPYRRRHICDLNLEHIDVNNVKDIHDLLGNILVTALYEGESIVNSHPDKKSSNNKSGICTSLARSFADIGDIIRGTDMFLGGKMKEKEKIYANIEKIFENIKKNDSSLKKLKNEQVREYWWEINRKQVWKVITCKAPHDANYFRKSPDGTNVFTSQGYCGRNENDDEPPTYLDYVPQFLRWFEEWAEHFCRVRKYKLEKVKDACCGKDDKKYCSVDGYDCKQTYREKNIFYVNLECPDCEKECRSYKKWIENQEQEFNKQINKYKKEINNVESKSVNTYDETFYNNLKTNYSLVEKFLETLNEGSQCKTSDAKHEIDFTKSQGIFSRSEWCKACPLLGLECDKRGKCVPKKENDENNRIGVDKGHKTAISTEIPILQNDGATNSIDEDLKACSKKYSLFKNMRKQEWTCQYLNGIDHCMINNIENDIDVDKNIKFKEFFERWLKYFIQDFNKVKDEINRCTKFEHRKDKICIKGCKNKCECVEKWINKKEEEWQKINKHYNQQKERYTNIIPRWVNSFLTHQQFSSDFINALKAFESISSLINLNKCNDEKCKINKIKNINEDLITHLLANLKKKIPTCKALNDDSNGKKCCIDMPKIAHDDEDEEDEDELPPPTPAPTTNACVKSSGADTTKTVTDVAKILYEKEKYRSSDISKLKGDASQGTYNRNGSAEDFKEEKLCTIKESHSNADGSKSKNPCYGKNKERFNIGKDWSDLEKKKKSSYTDVYLPQRREHMCTSNLEYLQTNKSPLNGSDSSAKGRSKINDSFLGDVLLAAKFEAEKIKELYEPTSDHESVCRAVSRSFADIGDIIKGTDMWDKDSGENKTQRNLQTLFGKIKEKHPGISGKYTDPHAISNVRKDWWEANRAKVWEAMQCAIKDFNTSTGYCQYKSCDRVPLDDYIPQRLRWMTEWAEWFCKMQKEEYDKLVTGCDKCWSKGGGKLCMNGDDECKTCKEACAKYKTKIETWKKQWEKISNIYKILYKIAAIDVGVGFPSYYSVHEKDKHVIEFLKKLHTQNGGDKSDTVYSTAEGYVHQEATMNCEKQHVFCEKKNGVKSDNGAEDNEYAFRNYPNGYDDACACENNKKPAPEPQVADEKRKGVCEIVKGILNNKKEKDTIGNCKGKYKNGITSYPGWNCNTQIDPKYTGACMPPRRQKLCIHYLAYKNETPKIQSQDNLREAFIKSAAAEIFFSWYKYKKDNSNLVDLQNELKKGEIPDDFKRQMFYTFGDYRDFLFGTNISKDHGKESDLGKKIDSLFEKAVRKNPNGKTREDWWQNHGPQIWEAMLCALENFGGNKEELKKKYGYETVKFHGDKISLEEFAQRPQFLRWMTEWSEHFCKKQSHEYDDLKKNCTRLDVSKDGTVSTDDYKKKCSECKTACGKYKGFVEKWQKDWKTQSDKYQTSYTQIKNDISSDPIERKLLEYLKELKKPNGSSDTYSTAGKYIKQEGYIIDCQESEQNNFDENNNDVSKRDYAFREYPHNYKDQCTCTDKSTPEPPPPPPLVPVVPAVNVCNILETLFKDTNKFKDACTQKYGGNQSRLGWKCVTRGGSGSETTDGLCIPPRRRKLYIHKLPDDSTITDATSLSKWFIESAAIETFFLWHKYKAENTKKPDATQVPANSLFKSLGLDDEDEDKKDAQELLNSGKIPDSFLRQMFYTLGDYKDILDEKNEMVIGNASSGSDKDMTEREKRIKDAIQRFFQNGDKKTVAGPPQASGEKNPRVTWWTKHGKYIWEGMICALTYKENDDKTIVKDEGVYEKFFGKHKGATDGTFKNHYQYNTVTLKDDDETGRPKETSASAFNDTPLLSHFISRPPFFRWLEEWGEEFCGTRKRMLEKIKDNCLDTYDDNQKYSGDGEACNEILPKNDGTVWSLESSSCPKSCSSYRKWIKRKKTEFDEQEKIYNTELKNAEGNNNDYKEFSERLKTWPNTAAFLQKLGSCKTNKENGEYKIVFDKPEETFKDAENCKSCPKFKINCKNGHCKGAEVEKCENKTHIGANDIEEMNENVEQVEILVIDNGEKGIADELNDVCKDAHIFKGIRKDEWKCGEVCGYVICKPKEGNGAINGKHIIQIRALMRLWLEYFLEDYKKIKHKISHCTKNGQSKCINGCNDKCKCVERWITKKRAEWENIKKRFNQQYKNEKDEYFNVRSFLETWVPQITDVNDKDKFIKLSKFDNSCGCSANPSSTNGKDKDAIDCMLKKLETRAKKCEEENKEPSGIPETECQDPTTLPDEEDLPLEEEENPVKAPEICKDVIKETAQEQTDGNCEEAEPPVVPENGGTGDEEKEEEEDKDNGSLDEPRPPAADSEDKSDQNPEQTPILKPEEEEPVPEVAPPPSTPAEKKEKTQKPRKPRTPKIMDEHPLLKPALMSSTLMWSVGISFAAISYFLLKKKSKSSVDLLRVLNIPKGEYEMPTLKSQNRYIPYRSGSYKGKTYIYMEGDTSGDEDKYIWDLSSSDITSSESEYEEFDINDIYVPGSPKYKTLIEVVLEPSQRDIPSNDMPPRNRFTDEEWSELKHDFISQYLPNTVPNNNYTSGDIPMNTEPNTLYFDNNQEKPFITSIHDRDLYTGEEISYNINMVNNDIPMSSNNNTYSGIDLINDSLSGEPIDIYDEVLKRKENELFGTKHTKRTSNNSVAKSTNSDPIMNQLDLLHKWLDKHRDMCEHWSNKDDILKKLNEEWNKDNDGGNVPIDNRTLNTDVSIQINMDHGKPKKEFTNMDTNVDTSTMDNILDDLETYNEPFYDIYEDDVYYDVNEDNKTSSDHNNLDVSSKVQIEMDVNSKLVKEKYPISDVWDI